ncbi:AAA family ATPase [Ruminococcus albus]|uniref:cytidylate kinase-like family protein n=1 Tax=Ruminococcus albus TaxID=1264 RepID=UPI002418A510|nr:cytidylate kinase-like family protein [Ruminococcus albus]
MLEYATYENCIIVGRCANYILRHRPNVLKVHFYAPYEKRLEMSIDDLNLSKGEAKSMIQKVDEARSSYYLYHTGEMFDSTSYQDVMINSSVFSFDENVENLCRLIKNKYPDLGNSDK